MTKLIIRSDDNPDWNGSWAKRDVEKEMKDLGCFRPDTPANEWIEYILDHVFDGEQAFPELVVAICSGKVRNIDLDFGGYYVTIKVM